jgi:hypothetical protein
MNCADFEIVLCDYIDGTLAPAQKADFERHLRECAGCAALAADAGAAVAFIGRAAEVQAPPELLTRISFAIPKAARPGVRGLFSSWLQPILQPRFAMGMAMTIVSFSMLGRFAGIEVRKITAADLTPTKVWAAADDRVHRGWERVVKYYDSLKLVYEVQSRLKEWTEQEEDDRRTQQTTTGPASSKTNAAQGNAATKNATDGKKSVEGRVSK